MSTDIVTRRAFAPMPRSANHASQRWRNSAMITSISLTFAEDRAISRVTAKSPRRSAISKPMAQRMPGLRGTSTRQISNSAALHADDADRPRHIGSHDGNDALCSGQSIHAQSCREAIDCCPSEITAHRHATAEQVCRVEGLQDDVGIGYGWLVISAVVAGRPRIGTGAARTDLEQSAAVHNRDRTTAGADRMDVEHWGFNRIAVDDRLPREPRLAPLQQRDIGGGAAHVEG